MAAEEFKDRLIAAREAAGLSQTELGKRADMMPTQVSRYESGRATPRRSAVVRLAGALGVSDSWLMAGATGPADAPSEDAEGNPQRAALRMFLPFEMMEQLKAAAEARGRTVGEEVRRRLESSLAEVPYELSYNPRMSLKNEDGSTTEMTLEELAKQLAGIMVKQQEQAARKPTPKKPAK